LFGLHAKLCPSASGCAMMIFNLSIEHFHFYVSKILAFSKSRRNIIFIDMFCLETINFSMLQVLLMLHSLQLKRFLLERLSFFNFFPITYYTGSFVASIVSFCIWHYKNVVFVPSLIYNPLNSELELYSVILRYPWQLNLLQMTQYFHC